MKYKDIAKELGFKGGSERLLHPELVAREISIEEIKLFGLIDCPIVYDLEVKDNHNYCITEDNIIVHNGGNQHKTL